MVNSWLARWRIVAAAAALLLLSGAVGLAAGRRGAGKYPCLKEVKRLTVGGARMPAWMSDGKRFLFVRSGRSPVEGLWLCEGEGVELKPLANLKGVLPAVSVDDRVAFVQRGDGGDAIMLAALRGTAEQLVAVGGRVTRLAWSPNGKYLAYTHAAAENTPRLDVYDLKEKRAESVRLSGCVDCAWSPDGRNMAVVRRRPFLGMQLVLVPMSSGKASEGPGKTPPTRILVDRRRSFLAVPSWSPDGNCIVFAETADEGRDILVYNLRDGKCRRFTFDGAGNIEPAWSPDGQSILFASRRAGLYHDIWRICLIYR